jgi:hypothetical protein
MKDDMNEEVRERGGKESMALYNNKLVLDEDKF